MTARLASVSKCLELYWVWQIWAQLFTATQRAAICECASAGRTRILGQHCQLPGRFPAALKVFSVDSWLVAECEWSNNSSTVLSLPSRRAPGSNSPAGLHASLPLTSCFLYASCPSLSICWALRRTSVDALHRFPFWKPVLSSKGLVPSRSSSLLSPSPRRISQVIPWKDVFLKNPDWVWLWEKDKSFLCCHCCFAIVILHSHSPLVFIKKDPCIINIVHPSTVTIKRTPYFHTTHDLQGYR